MRETESETCRERQGVREREERAIERGRHGGEREKETKRDKERQKGGARET